MSIYYINTFVESMVVHESATIMMNWKSAVREPNVRRSIYQVLLLTAGIVTSTRNIDITYFNLRIMLSHAEDVYLNINCPFVF